MVCQGLRKGSVAAALVAGLLIGAGPPASAQTFYSNRGDFNAAFSGLTLENFEEAAVGQNAVVGIPGPIDSGTSDGVFGVGDIADGLRIDSNPAEGAKTQGLAVSGDGFMSLSSKKVFSNLPTDALDLAFYNNDVHEVGFDLSSAISPGNIVVDIYGVGGKLLGSKTVFAAAGGNGTFFGVSSTDIITRINLNSPVSNWEGVDNVAFGSSAPTSAPEPASLALLLPGLVPLGLALRRRRRPSPD